MNTQLRPALVLFLALSFHVVDVEDDGSVSRVGPVNNNGMWINGGYMVLEECIFDHLDPGEELVEEPFNRLAAKGKLHAYRHTGNWIGIDTSCFTSPDFPAHCHDCGR